MQVIPKHQYHMQFVKTFTLILIISYIVYNVNYKTSWPFNSFLHRYFGKDDGIFRQLESTCMLSALFYFTLASRRKIVFLLLGFVTGLLSYIFSLFISHTLTDNLLFTHIFACILFIGLYYALPRRWKYKKQLKLTVTSD